MKAIFASKMYKSSTRKDKIKAGLENPVNAELVEQLREYLDDEYLTPEYFPESAEPVLDPSSESSDSAGASSDSFSGSHSAPSGGGGGNPFMDGDIGNAAEGLEEGMFVDGEEVPAGDESDTADGEVPTEDDAVADVDSDVESATAIKASCVMDFRSLPEQLKGTLNSRQDTAGVSRVSCKENELWIYYNDKMNLNNVMGPVIDLLNAASYTYLDFNRLARTDNAMVFEISISDSDNQVKPAEDDSDGTEA